MVNIKMLLTGVILLIVAVIVIFSVVGNSAVELDSAGNSVTDANNCSEDTWTDAAGITPSYDQTTKQCENSTGGDLYLAGQYDLPLNSLFASGGVVFLIFMAVILLLIVGLVLKKGFKK